MEQDKTSTARDGVFGGLPPEIMEMIIDGLIASSYVRLSFTCSHFASLLEREGFWQKLFHSREENCVVIENPQTCTTWKQRCNPRIQHKHSTVEEAMKSLINPSWVELNQEEVPDLQLFIKPGFHTTFVDNINTTTYPRFRITGETDGDKKCVLYLQNHFFFLAVDCDTIIVENITFVLPTTSPKRERFPLRTMAFDDTKSKIHINNCEFLQQESLRYKYAATNNSVQISSSKHQLQILCAVIIENNTFNEVACSIKIDEYVYQKKRNGGIIIQNNKFNSCRSNIIIREGTIADYVDLEDSENLDLSLSKCDMENTVVVKSNEFINGTMRNFSICSVEPLEISDNRFIDCHIGVLVDYVSKLSVINNSFRCKENCITLNIPFSNVIQKPQIQIIGNKLKTMSKSMNCIGEVIFYDDDPDRVKIEGNVYEDSYDPLNPENKDLELWKKKIHEEGKKKCTYAFTQDNFFTQFYMQCADCAWGQNRAICMDCAQVCHKGHRLIKRLGEMYCDDAAHEECCVLNSRAASQEAAGTGDEGDLSDNEQD